MFHLTYEEKIQLMRSLNWDYLDNPQDMLGVIEGRLQSSGQFTREKLFVRSIERLPWHYFTALWGIESIKKLYTPEIANRIWPSQFYEENLYPLQDGVMNILQQSGTDFFLTGAQLLAKYRIVLSH